MPMKRSDRFDAELKRSVETALGAGVRSADAVSGGDTAIAMRVALDDARTVFLKTHASPPPGFFTTEANGLSWLRDSERVAVPEVLGVSDDPPWLALDWIDVAPGGAPAAGEAAFGRALAGLHGSAAACFGREDGRTTGSLAVPNTPCSDWPTFYATCRLEPLAQRAADARALRASTIERLRRLTGRLSDFGAADEPPARLHGDLWAGNRIVDRRGTSWLIDPAAHGGHREFDLAMMRLFGGFGDAVFAAYQEVDALQPGWQQRIALHQLAPLVVHAIKFGGAYAGAVDEALAQLV